MKAQGGVELELHSFLNCPTWRLVVSFIRRPI